MSWDRARAIPWSKLSQVPGEEFDKEQIFREMEMEAALQAQAESQQASSVVEGEDETQENKGVSQGIPFSGMEMAKQAAFGGCIGA